MDNFDLKSYLSNNPLLTEIKINSPFIHQKKPTEDQIKNLPVLDLKIGKYDVSKGRKGIKVPFNSPNISTATKDRALRIFNKLGIQPKNSWIAWATDSDGNIITGKSTFILSYYKDEPILIAQTQTENPIAGQIYIYSNYFKSGKALRLPDGENGPIDTSSLSAENATKEQILQALKIPQ